MQIVNINNKKGKIWFDTLLNRLSEYSSNFEDTAKTILLEN